MVVKLDARVEGMSVSPTLAARIRSASLAVQGQRVFRLGLGQSPFPVPAPLVAALRAAAAEKEYLPPGGLHELRRAVADHHRARHGLSFAAEDVLIGPGSKELIFLLQLCFAGDIVLPTPRWVSYVPQARLAGREVVELPGGGRHGLMIDPERVADVCRGAPGRQRVLFFNSPCNPTGLAFTADELEALAAVCRERGVLVLSDEIYAELCFPGRHLSIAQLYPEGTIVVSGLSKWCGAGGWRLGTMAFPPELRPLRRALEAVASETFSSTSAPIQHAAVTAFKPQGEIEAYLVAVRRILAAALGWATAELTSVGLDVPEPAAAFYLFPGFAPLREPLAAHGIHTDIDLVERLLADTGLVAIPGSAFGCAPAALRVRLALVDFDGAHALAGLADGPADLSFLQRYLTPTWNGIMALTHWSARLGAPRRAL